MLYIKEPNGHYRIADEDDVIDEANAIYDRYFSRGEQIESPEKAQNYLRVNWQRSIMKSLSGCS